MFFGGGGSKGPSCDGRPDLVPNLAPDLVPVDTDSSSWKNMADNEKSYMEKKSSTMVLYQSIIFKNMMYISAGLYINIYIYVPHLANECVPWVSFAS